MSENMTKGMIIDCINRIKNLNKHHNLTCICVLDISISFRRGSCCGEFSSIVNKDLSSPPSLRQLRQMRPTSITSLSILYRTALIKTHIKSINSLQSEVQPELAWAGPPSPAYSATPLYFVFKMAHGVGHRYMADGLQSTFSDTERLENV